MAQLGEVAFALERFEWSDEDRLEVVGRWEGLQGRRMGRPVLTIVDGSGRRRRLNALPGGQLGSERPWRASFACEGGTVAVQSAELELGRRLVVELPPPRRRRRRSAATPPPRAAEPTPPFPRRPDPGPDPELAKLRDRLATVEREREESRKHAADLEAQLVAARAEADDARERLQTARDGIAEREQRILTAEADAVRAGDESAQALEAERAATTTARAETATARAELGTARDELAQAREELAGTRDELAGTRDELTGTRNELATTHDELTSTRDDLATAGRELADARKELGTLRARVAAIDEPHPAVQTMLEGVTGDLEQERETVRQLRAEIETLQKERDGNPGPARIPTAPATQRVEAVRAAGPHRVPAHERSPVQLWGTRAVAAVLVALLLAALALIVAPLL